MVELVTKKETQYQTYVGNLTFELEIKLTHCYFRVLTLGFYNVILGMD